MKGAGALFGVVATTFMRWEDNGVPPERLAEIAQITGLSVRRLRPDLFPAPKARLA